MGLKKFTLTQTLLLAASPALAATGDDLQSLRSIQQAAESYITTEVREVQGLVPEVRAGRLDSRLRLTHCDKPLESFLPPGGRMLGNVTVGVRCNGSKSWTLYVPVKVSIHEKVVTALRPLSRGMILGKDNLKLVEKDLALLNSGYYTDISELAGKETTRSVIMGAAITTPMVKATQQVRRGQRVSLVAEASGLAVRMRGEALANGAAGERIRVRNLSSKRIVEGIVLSPTTVRVSM